MIYYINKYVKIRYDREKNKIFTYNCKHIKNLTIITYKIKTLKIKIYLSTFCVFNIDVILLFNLTSFLVLANLC